ncbi:MAG: hypothetical protein ACUVTD_02495 [Nitrososphaerales archaeon]
MRAVENDDLEIVPEKEAIERCYPRRPNAGKFTQLLELISSGVAGFRPLPKWVVEEARLILSSMAKRRYPTQGRRLASFVIAALAIARGDEHADKLNDLIYRAESILGKRIPVRQVRNVFLEVRAFWLRNRSDYPLQYNFTLTPEEKKYLQRLRRTL